MSVNETPPVRRKVGRPPLPHRKGEILDAAARLFNERGFHAVSINDIGDAVGMTGPGIYRHFPNKHAILVAIIDRTNRLIRQSPEPDEAPPDIVLRHKIKQYAELVIEHHQLIAVLLSERENLPPDAAKEVRDDMRQLVRTWTDLLMAARTELSRPAAQAAVNATFGLLNSVTGFRSRLSAADLRDLVVHMAYQGLELPAKKQRSRRTG